MKKLLGLFLLVLTLVGCGSGGGGSSTPISNTPFTTEDQVEATNLIKRLNSHYGEYANINDTVNENQIEGTMTFFQAYPSINIAKGTEIKIVVKREDGVYNIYNYVNGHYDGKCVGTSIKAAIDNLKI